MRLINVHTLKLHTFFDEGIPRYAILSHTWTDTELTLQEFVADPYGGTGCRPGSHVGCSEHGFAGQTPPHPMGIMKIWLAADQARRDGYEWVWADTVCIDKTSSAELSEAINSMYEWYRISGVCYAFLTDVRGPASNASPGSPQLSGLGISGVPCGPPGGVLSSSRPPTATNSSSPKSPIASPGSSTPIASPHDPVRSPPSLTRTATIVQHTPSPTLTIMSQMSADPSQASPTSPQSSAPSTPNTSIWISPTPLKPPTVEFRVSKWFSRGWTLQELIAPATVIFYGEHWSVIGHREELSSQLEEATGISREIFDVPSHPSAGKLLPPLIDRISISVADRLAWASRRFTTRAEDRAYSLFGITNVNMPLLYGEGGARAFFRLQSEILEDTDDHSLFVWNVPPDHPDAWGLAGVLAPSPQCFDQLALVGRRNSIQQLGHELGEPCAITRKGLFLHAHVSRIMVPPESLLGIYGARSPAPNFLPNIPRLVQIVLNCRISPGKRVAIFAWQISGNTYARLLLPWTHEVLDNEIYSDAEKFERIYLSRGNASAALAHMQPWPSLASLDGESTVHFAAFSKNGKNGSIAMDPGPWKGKRSIDPLGYNLRKIRVEGLGVNWNDRTNVLTFQNTYEAGVALLTLVDHHGDALGLDMSGRNTSFVSVLPPIVLLCSVTKPDPDLPCKIHLLLLPLDIPPDLPQWQVSTTADSSSSPFFQFDGTYGETFAIPSATTMARAILEFSHIRFEAELEREREWSDWLGPQAKTPEDQFILRFRWSPVLRTGDVNLTGPDRYFQEKGVAWLQVSADGKTVLDEGYPSIASQGRAVDIGGDRRAE